MMLTDLINWINSRGIYLQENAIKCALHVIINKEQNY